MVHQMAVYLQAGLPANTRFTPVHRVEEYLIGSTEGWCAYTCVSHLAYSSTKSQPYCSYILYKMRSQGFRKGCCRMALSYVTHYDLTTRKPTKLIALELAKTHCTE